MGKYGVVTGGTGAPCVGEAWGILLCRGTQIQILLQKQKKRAGKKSKKSNYFRSEMLNLKETDKKDLEAETLS